MSYTPEDIRKAADVLRELNKHHNGVGSWYPHQLDDRATLLENELAEEAAAEALKDERIDELANDTGLNLTIRQARLLVERFPALLA